MATARTNEKKVNKKSEPRSREGERHTLPQGDFLTVNFKCLVGMRTGPLTDNCCFLPAAIKDADAADGISDNGKYHVEGVEMKKYFREVGGKEGVGGGGRQNAPFSTSSLLREVKVMRMRW